MDVEVVSVMPFPLMMPNVWRNPATLTGKAYDTVTLQVPYGVPSSAMFTEAPEIPAEERMLFARERADAGVPLDGGDPDGLPGGPGQDVPGHPRPAEFGDPDQQEEKHREHECELHQALPSDRFIAPSHRCFSRLR